MAKEIDRNGRDLPKTGEKYRHFKGKEYEIVCIAAEEATDSPLVIYKALYGEGKIWARPLSSFLGDVNLKKHPEATQKYRFELIGGAPVFSQEEEKSADTVAEAENKAAETSTDENGTAPWTVTEASPEESAAEEGEYRLDPLVEKFLDAQTIDEKLDILGVLHATVTDSMIDTMAMASGLEIEAGSIEDRYHDLRDCLRTINHYEADSNRLR